MFSLEFKRYKNSKKEELETLERLEKVKGLETAGRIRNSRRDSKQQ